MTHLVIQIPCYNEAANIRDVVAGIPRVIAGVSRITVMVVDDGSTDGTGEIAKEAGADIVLRLARRGGVARAFVAGIERAVASGADVIINLDGDNQHPPALIPDLALPILNGEADLVIGVRDETSMRAFPPIKRALESLGSWVARKISGTGVADGPSGFRALSRDAAMRLHVFNRYSYTLETLIQAGQLGLAVATVPIRSEPANRPSRVVGSVWHYVLRQGLTMVRVFMAYRPFKFFAIPGLASVAISALLAIRHLALYFLEGRAGRIQSLLMAAVLFGVGVALIVVGLLADLIAVNRRLLEDIDWRVKRIEHGGVEADRTDRQS